MKINVRLMLLAASLLLTGKLSAQSISQETIEVQILKQPTEAIEVGNRNFKIVVSSPYNLTADQVIKQKKADHEKAVANYSKVVADSEKEFQQKTKEHDGEVTKAKEKYALESAEFKKLSILERLALTDQKKNPKLVIPSQPVYQKPEPPVYVEPDLNEYMIVDNNVLASQIAISGFSRGAGYLDVAVDMKPVGLQDNAGQTFANQPTKVIVKINGKEGANKTFFEEYTFLSSSPSNNINKPLEEKNHLSKVVKFLNDYLNEMYGYQAVPKSVKILSVKNKGKFDDLERADIYVKTNLRKLQPENPEINAAAFANMQKGVDIWTQTLAKVEYKNDKADFNAKIAEFLYFNLIRLSLALDKKTDAEKYLNQLQENLIYIKLSYDEENELKRIEKEIYQKNK